MHVIEKVYTEKNILFFFSLGIRSKSVPFGFSSGVGAKILKIYEYFKSKVINNNKTLSKNKSSSSSRQQQHWKHQYLKSITKQSNGFDWFEPQMDCAQWAQHTRCSERSQNDTENRIESKINLNWSILKRKLKQIKINTSNHHYHHDHSNNNNNEKATKTFTKHADTILMVINCCSMAWFAS